MKYIYDITVHSNNDMIGDFINAISYADAKKKAIALSKKKQYEGQDVSHVDVNRYLTDKEGYGAGNDMTETYIKGKYLERIYWNVGI